MCTNTKHSYTIMSEALSDLCIIPILVFVVCCNRHSAFAVFHFMFFFCFSSFSFEFEAKAKKKCRHLQQTQAATNDGTAGKRNPCRWRSRIRRKKRDFFKTVNNLVYARGYIVYGICNERHSKKSYSPSKLQIHIFSLLQIVFGFIMPNTK